MKALLMTTAASTPVSAWAHGPGPVAHAHPHGLEIILVALVIGAFVGVAPTAWRAFRALRGRHE